VPDAAGPRGPADVAVQRPRHRGRLAAASRPGPARGLPRNPPGATGSPAPVASRGLTPSPPAQRSRTEGPAPRPRRQPLYQFYVHTETIKKPPRPFEYVFNTPTRRRVHHGSDPIYPARNYAGILIVRDRPFGAFQRARFRSAHGLTRPVEPYNLVKLQYGDDQELMTRRPHRLVMAGPAWLSVHAARPAAEVGRRLRSRKYCSSKPITDFRHPRRARAYHLPYVADGSHSRMA
jgi:hypothetical protein